MLSKLKSDLLFVPSPQEKYFGFAQPWCRQTIEVSATDKLSYTYTYIYW